MSSDVNLPDIAVLIKYAVSEADYEEAVRLANGYAEDPVASRVLYHYYGDLPEAREEMATGLAVVAEKQGVLLYGLKTTGHQYLYLGSADNSIFIGRYEDGIGDEEILAWFGYRSRKECREALPDLTDEIMARYRKGATRCVACGVREAEEHVLGCPVEQCPWCGGQLSRCNCRFDQLGVDEIGDEELVEQFAELLAEKGRIPFRAGQGPSYPVAGDDPGPAGKKDCLSRPVGPIERWQR